MATVYLGIGSNLGDRQANIDAAKRMLEENRIAVLQSSRLIETQPVGGPPGQRRYLNGVLKVATEQSPEQLLKTLKSIEKKLGRVKTVPDGPRPIDLDILLYDRIQYQSTRLTIPHPRMWGRDFVMKPLREINASLVESLAHAHR